jgi:hypothetical protein
MNKKFTDEQLDLIAEKLVNNFALNDEKLNEIADSPKLFWNVKREIKLQKPEQNKGWTAIWYRQIFAFSAFAALAVSFGIGLIWLLNFPLTEDVAKVETPIIEPAKIVESKNNEPKVVKEIEKNESQVNKSNNKIPQKVVVKSMVEPAKVIQTKTVTPKIEPKIIPPNQLKATPKQTPKAVEINSANEEEVKTEFISLSYLPTPESGQIVRVKVPRAMMVSLGVSNNVSKNAEMVSAEVILGDDGSSRAIRFISTDKK